jgi:hypothetical protein
MTANPYQDIAKEFMDLWQKQMSSVMGDKQFIHAMLDLFKNMQAKSSDATSHATTHTAATSDAQHDMLSQLAFRLAMCEKRLAALEGKKPVARKAAKRGGARGKKPNK